MTLNEILDKHGADKHDGAHGYARYYSALFEPWRNEPITLLEIGVWHGASIQAWLEYFPNAFICGLDNDGNCWKSDNPRYHWYYCDQCNEAALCSVRDSLERLDVVIDDGCHLPHAQAKSFEFLWPKLAPGGLYIIEDLHPWFDPKQNACWHDGASEFLWRLATAVNWTGCRYLGRPFADEAPSSYDQDFETIFIAKGLLVIRKAGLHFSQAGE